MQSRSAAEGVFFFTGDYLTVTFTVVVLETPCDVAVTVTLEGPF